MHESNALLVDQALLADKFGRRDDTAFTKLMRRHYELVFRICFRMLGHRQDAEDATQETFSRLARHLNQWDRSRPLEPWLVTIAGNRCRTLLGRRRVHRSLAPADEPATTVSTQQHDAESLAEEVQLALTFLPHEQQIAFRMFHEQALGYNEIAIELDRPVGTVKTWVHRARMRMLETLTERDVLELRPRNKGTFQ